MSQSSLAVSLGLIPGSFSRQQSVYLEKAHSIVILITKGDGHTGSVILCTVLDFGLCLLERLTKRSTNTLFDLYHLTFSSINTAPKHIK